MDQFIFRKATASDLEAICRIFWDLLSIEDYEKTVRWKKDVYPSMSDFEKNISEGKMYVLSSGESAVGAVMVTEEQADGYRNVNWNVTASDNEVFVIHLLAVHPDYMKQGLASLIIDHICDMAKQAGKKAIRLDAIRTNTKAQKFYERKGFINCGSAELYYASVGREEFVFYELPLTGV